MRKICNVISTAIVIVIVVLAGLLVVPTLLGCHGYAVLSGSMEPNIGVGAIVYTKAVEWSELEKGDVITYKLGESLVTHRIVEINAQERTVITQGDANDVVDGSPVSYGNIVGRVAFHVPMLGYMSIYIKTPLGIAVGCGILAMLIVLNLLPDIFSGKKEEKIKKSVMSV